MLLSKITLSTVKERKGSYYDALRCKKSRVIPFIVETLGGITPHAVAYVGQLARRAQGKGARDATKYGRSRTSARSYFRHHTERIAMAAKLGDANAIYKDIQSRRQLILQPGRGRAVAGA